MIQYFKGDDRELQFDGAASPILSILSAEKSLMFDECFNSYLLGDLIFSDNRSPLSNAIKRSIFVSTFKELFDSFITAGNFESYLTVFRKIFGDDVEVEFTVPNPGHLQIDIDAAGVELSPMITRYIVDNAYVYDSIVDDEGDNIVFQTIKGFETQYELEKMLFEMVPGGMFTEITLSVGV
jgi:hypothetical protein